MVLSFQCNINEDQDTSVICTDVGSMQQLSSTMQSNWHRLAIVNAPGNSFTNAGKNYINNNKKVYSSSFI